MLPFLSQKVFNRNHIVVLSGSGGLADCIASMRMPTLDMPFKYELTTDADQTATSFVIEGEFASLRLIYDESKKRHVATSNFFLGVLKKCLLLRLHGDSIRQPNNITVKDHYSCRNYEFDFSSGFFKSGHRSSTLHFRIFISVNINNAQAGEASFVHVELLDGTSTHLASFFFRIEKSGIKVVNQNSLSRSVLTISSPIIIKRGDAHPQSFVVDFDATPLDQARDFVLHDCIDACCWKCDLKPDGALHQYGQQPSSIANIDQVHVHVRSTRDFPDEPKEQDRYLNSNISVSRFLSRMKNPSFQGKYKLDLHKPHKDYIMLGAQHLLCADSELQKMICEIVSSQYVLIYSSKEIELDDILKKITSRLPSLPSSEVSVLKRLSSNISKYPSGFGGRHGLLGYEWSARKPPSAYVSSGTSQKLPSASVEASDNSRAFVCIAENNKHDVETVIPLLLHHGVSGDRLESIPWESNTEIPPNIVFSFAENYAAKELSMPGDANPTLHNIFHGLLQSIPAAIGAWMLSSCSSTYISDSLSLFLREAKRTRSGSHPSCGFFGLGNLENTLAALAKDFQSQKWYNTFEESIFKGSLNNNNLFLGIGVQVHQPGSSSDANVGVPLIPSRIADKSILAGLFDAMIFVSNSEKIDDTYALFHGSTSFGSRQEDYALNSVVQFKCRFLSILRDTFRACHVCVAYIPTSHVKHDRAELENPHNTSLINEVLFASRLNSGILFCHPLAFITSTLLCLISLSRYYCGEFSDIRTCMQIRFNCI